MPNPPPGRGERSTFGPTPVGPVDVIWNFASLTERHFATPIWNGRLPRPPGHESRMFLANAIEHAAATIAGGDQLTRLRQGAADIALHVRRGDMRTWRRNQVGGNSELIPASVWADWLANDEFPAIVASCAYRTLEPWGVVDWDVYMETADLRRCFPPPADPVLVAPAALSPSEMSVPAFVRANLDTADANIRARGERAVTSTRERELHSMWQADRRPAREISTFHQAVIAAITRPEKHR